jgi:hypothetical protein
MARKGQALVVRAWRIIRPGNRGVCSSEKTFTPTAKLVKAMEDAQAGLIRVDRENDKLTHALGNPEHTGRTRGKGAGDPWKAGFSQHEDLYGYKSHKRKKDRETDRIGKVERELADMKRMMHELRQEGSSRPQEDPALDINSQRSSSMASTEVPADEHDAQMIDDAPGPRYLVDDVREMTNCELHQPMKNMTFKVAIGNALPCLPEALHHGNLIRDGYARVLVNDIVSGFEDLELDFPTPEGDVRLGDVKRHIVLWQKKYIMFPSLAPRPPTPRKPSPPSPGERRPPTPPPSPPQEPHQPTPSPSPPWASCQPMLPPSAPPARLPMPSSSTHPAHQAKSPPNTTQKGEKQSRAATVSTTDKVVHKTTKIPGPSLKPLP